ncbi:DUF3040 domain-containing protein [Streptomyces pseudovenezuelae]|uniref:DUF3040 domain-containing protein n=1 Tax=Streptomyces pseudovenezuelae TaxID=67350 RepID=A0ABT6LDP4_9ACTN|nr:DUF3040 domain-containing protein [Streptomyces pseudovenezuelae]MDH6214045.1 hypothetical protein [Streptomyces pseudovenezuelae]
MHRNDAERLADLEARLEQDDPRFTHALRAGRPARPREYRRTGLWYGLAVGAAVLIAGVVVPDGLLIATGLVLMGIAAQLLDPRQAPPRRRGNRSAGP